MIIFLFKSVNSSYRYDAITGINMFQIKCQCHLSFNILRDTLMLFSKTHLLRLHLPTEYKGDIHSCASVTTLDTGSTSQASRKVCVIENYFSYFSTKTCHHRDGSFEYPKLMFN